MKSTRRATRQHAYAAAGLLALALMAVLASATRSGAERLRKASATLRERQDALAALQTRVKDLRQLESRHGQLVADLALLEPAVPTGAYVPTLLRQMEHMVTDTGSHMLGLKPEQVLHVAAVRPPTENGEAGPPQVAAGAPKSKTAERYERVPIEMSVETNYAALLAFLDGLSKFPKMVAVNEMSITPVAKSLRAEAASKYTFTGKIDIVALIQKQEPKQWKSGAKS